MINNRAVEKEQITKQLGTIVEDVPKNSTSPLLYVPWPLYGVELCTKPAMKGLTHTKNSLDS